MCFLAWFARIFLLLCIHPKMKTEAHTQLIACGQTGAKNWWRKKTASFGLYSSIDVGQEKEEQNKVKINFCNKSRHTVDERDAPAFAFQERKMVILLLLWVWAAFKHFSQNDKLAVPTGRVRKSGVFSIKEDVRGAIGQEKAHKRPKRRNRNDHTTVQWEKEVEKEKKRVAKLISQQH